MADALPQSMVDENGRELCLEVNTTNGYFNATLMCKSAGKKWNDYYRNKTTSSYLQCLSSTAGIVATDLVYQSGGGNNHRHTWVHRKVATNLAQWISPRFAVWASDLVELFLTNRLTTSDSAKATDSLNAIVHPIDWQGKREVARHLTKKSDKIHEVTGGKAKAEYPKVNPALVRSVAGQIPKTLQKAHGFTDTPRNYMPQAMLGLLSYGEHQVDAELDKAYKKFGRFLSEGEVTAVAYHVTNMIYDMCKNTGGFDTPLLQSSPAPATTTKKRKALAEPPKEVCKQQKLIMCH